MSVRINIADIGSSDIGQINNLNISGSRNNISTYRTTSEYEDNVLSETSNVGNNVFLLGESKLGQGAKYASKYSGFIGTIKSDGTGKIEDFSITINGENIKQIRLSFDKVTNQYATYLDINGTKVYNNNNYLEYNFDEAQSTIIIDNIYWNKTYSYFRLTSITISTSLNFDSKNGLQSLTRGVEMISDNTNPNFGLISNYATIKIIDKDYRIENLANQDLLNDEREVKIFFNEKQVGVFLTKTFEKEGNEITIDLKDKMLNLQNIIIENKTFKGEQTLAVVFEFLLTKLEENGYVFSVAHQYSILEKLESYVVNNLILESDSLWNQLSKICQIINYRMYMNENGVIEGREL